MKARSWIIALIAFWPVLSANSLPLRPIDSENGRWARDRVLIQLHSNAKSTSVTDWPKRLGLPARSEA